MDSSLAKISDFHVGRVIHEGERSHIFEARYAQSGGVVSRAAMKILRPEYACIGDELRAFLRELSWARELRHRAFPSVLEAGEHAGAYFLAMELLEGRNLSELCAHEGIPRELAIYIVREICDAIETVHAFEHEGHTLVHLGVCPHNIFLRNNGGVVLFDFGNVAYADAKDEELRICKEGHYAPEVTKSKVVTRQADVYAIGSTLQSMLDSTPHAIDSRLHAIVRIATANDPRERFSSAAQLGHELGEIARSEHCEIDMAAAARIIEDMYGQQRRSDPRSGRQQENVPFYMRSEDEPTAFAEPVQDNIEDEEEEETEVQSESREFTRDQGGQGATVQAPVPETDRLRKLAAKAEADGGPTLGSASRSFTKEHEGVTVRAPVPGSSSPAAVKAKGKKFVDEHQAVTALMDPGQQKDLMKTEKAHFTGSQNTVIADPEVTGPGVNRDGFPRRETETEEDGSMKKWMEEEIPTRFSNEDLQRGDTERDGDE